MKRIVFILLILITLINITYANQILYMKKSSEDISTGTVLTNYEILTEEGWINVHVLELDLYDRYNTLTLLTSEEGSKKLASTLSMANYKNAIGGINADFFSGSKGIGYSIGLAIDDGKVYSSAAEENKQKDIFTSFIINEDDEIIYNYLQDVITIYCGKNNEEIKARFINKYTDNTDIPTILTREWNEFSFGSTEILPVTEFVVEKGKVTYIAENEPPVEIPEDGYVIMATGESAEFLKENLNLKSPVRYEITYTPNVENIKFAVSGGTKLIENGIIPESYSHDVKGRNPRTIIGTNKDKSKVFLIAIDGRSKKSLGVTLEEASQLMEKLNVYTAINLDGGGSTTMVARHLGEEELEEINVPSGGQERVVANGVGIVSTAKDSSKLYGLKINLYDNNVFVNERRKVSVVGYNKYYNPVEIDIDDVTWDYEGVELIYESGEIYGEKPGKSTLIAKIGKVKGECEINILSQPNEIYVYPKETTINPGEKVTYTLHSKDKDGNYAATLLSSYDLKIENYYLNGESGDIPEDATVEGHSFMATSGGTYIISISKDDIKTYTKVDIANETFKLIDDFETQTFTFDPYPDEVGGNATLSSEQKYTGEYSARLDYDFDQEIQIRGAYIVLNEEAIIPPEATHLSFYVYNDGFKEEMLKVKWKDANDQTKLVVIQDNISHEGWQEIRYDVSSYAKPLRISDIYVAQDDISSRNEGTIYVDRLGYYVKGDSTKSDINIPKDEKNEEKNPDYNLDVSFNISFVESFKKPSYMIDVIKTKRMVQNINASGDLTIVIDGKNEEFVNTYVEYVSTSGDEELKNLKYPLITLDRIKTPILYNEGYDLYSNDDCTIITMDVNQKGIRKSNFEQYFYFEDDILDDETGNVIIVLNGTLDDFTDEKEKNILIDTLNKISEDEDKNIIIVQKGYYQGVQMEKGIKILGIKDENTSFEDAHNCKFLMLHILENEIVYEYKSAW